MATKIQPGSPATEFQKASMASGGRGVGLRQNTTLSEVSAPILLGQSPGSGTACTLFLATLFDTAYDNATVDFIAMSFGRSAIFETLTITPAIVAAQPAIELTVSGCAADYWEVQITLNNGVAPALPTQSSILATGVEIIPSSGGGGGSGTVTDVTAALPLSVATGTTTPAISTLGFATIVFQPGGTASANVYTTAAAVGAALAAFHGAAVVYVDSSLATATIPSGVTWDFQGRGELSGGDPFSGPTGEGGVLTVEDGGIVQNLTLLTSGQVICKCTTVPTFNYTGLDGNNTLVVDNLGSITLDASATISPFVVAAGDEINIVLKFYTEFDNTAAAGLSFFELQTGGGAGLGGTLSLFIIDGVSIPIPTNLFSGDTTTNYFYAGDSSAFPMPVWTASSVATQAPTIFDNAVGVNYDDTLAPPTTGEVNVQSILDYLKQFAPLVITGTTPVGGGVFNIPVPIATGKTAQITYELTGRQTATGTAGGAVGDTVTSILYDSLKNVSGTPGAVGSGSPTTNPSASFADTSMASISSLSGSASANLATLTVTTNATAGAVAWRCLVYVNYT
jgi:hypothetical protein